MSESSANEFGLSVSLSGHHIVVGAPGDSALGGGAAFIYSYYQSVDGNFEIFNTTLLFEGTSKGSRYGESVAVFEAVYNRSDYVEYNMENNTIAAIACVGAPMDHFNGRVYVYYLEDIESVKKWRQEQIILSPVHISRFGSSISLYNDIMVTGLYCYVICLALYFYIKYYLPILLSIIYLLYY